MPEGLKTTSRCQVTTVERKLLIATQKLIGEIKKASGVHGSGGSAEEARTNKFRIYCDLFMGSLLSVQEQSNITVFFSQVRNNQKVPRNIRAMAKKVYDDLVENHKGR